MFIVTINKLRIITAVIVAISLVLAALTLFVPLPAGSTADASTFHARFGLITLFALFDFGAAILFLIGLGEFKTELRRAYKWIVVGLITLGVANLQFPIFDYFNLWDHPWFTYGGSFIAWTLGHLFILIGVRRFASLLQIKTFLLSLAACIVLIIGASTAISVLPHVSTGTPVPEIFFDLAQVLRVAAAIIGLVAAGIVLMIRKTIGASYHKAMTWFCLALIASSLSIMQLVLFQLIGYDNMLVTQLVVVPYVFAALLFIKSGHEFNKIRFF